MIAQSIAAVLLGLAWLVYVAFSLDYHKYARKQQREWEEKMRRDWPRRFW